MSGERDSRQKKRMVKGPKRTMPGVFKEEQASQCNGNELDLDQHMRSVSLGFVEKVKTLAFTLGKMGILEDLEEWQN